MATKKHNAKTVLLPGIRVTPALAAALDRYHKQLQLDIPGCTRSTAMRAALWAALK
jgi:hypothetical protein